MTFRLPKFARSSWPNWGDFAVPRQHDPQLERLWQVSRILNRSPFSDEVLDLTDIQIEYIFQMYANDHPDEVKYTPLDMGESTLRLINWEEHLEGVELEKYIKRPHDFINKKIADTYESIKRTVVGKQKSRM